eukprot:1335942-Amorphochlora_amoeboformis.AAC.1
MQTTLGTQRENSWNTGNTWNTGHAGNTWNTRNTTKKARTSRAGKLATSRLVGWLVAQSGDAHAIVLYCCTVRSCTKA